MQLFSAHHEYGLDPLQRTALSLMAALVCLTFVATNAQALLWQSSDWLIGTVLPAVVVDLTNEERQSSVPLTRSARLDEAAAAKAAHMAREGYFAHYAPDGTSPWDFFADVSYTYAHAGENLAIHFTDSAEVVDAWMNSPAHKENIVNPLFTEIGVGTARGQFDGYDTVFVVQLFGTPAAVPTAISAPELTVSEPVAQPATETAVPDTTTIAELTQQAEALQAELAARTETNTSAPALNTEVAGSLDETVSVAPAPVFAAAEPQAIPVAVVDTVPDTIPDVVDIPQVYTVSTEMNTSTGLAAAAVVEEMNRQLSVPSAGATVATVITRPTLVLQVVYSVVVAGILALLCIALWGEARRFHYVQAAYSVLLLVAVAGLWAVHVTLTGGAVIV